MATPERQRPERNEIYEHVSGRFYTIVCVATCPKSLNEYVVHRGNHDGRYWTRSLENFIGKHESGVDRFVLKGGVR